MELKVIAPTALTIGNLLSGFLSLVHTAQGRPTSAAWWIILAWLLDGLDGQVARMVRSSTRFGAELDSLADLSSFGLAPALLIYRHWLHRMGMLGAGVTFLFFVCGALRLARFNAQRRTADKENFSGLPIPAAAWMLASYVLFPEEGPWWVVPGLAVVAAGLMLAPLEYDAMCFPLKGAWGKVKVGLFVAGAAFILSFPIYALFPLSLVYLASGPVRGLILKSGFVPRPGRR